MTTIKLSVIIPVYNEETFISEIIKRVLSKDIVSETIIVNDGSTDKTSEVLNGIKNIDNRLKVINLSSNSGKGAAVIEGLKHVTGDVVIIQDADLEYSPDDYPKLVEPFNDPKVNVVYGSRILKKDNPISHVSFLLGGLFLTFLTNILYGSSITDEPTGYKLFRSSIIQNLKLECKGFEFCPEVTAKILRKGIKINELPISYFPRKVSQGKKIKLKDGLKAIWTLLYYRFANID